MFRVLSFVLMKLQSLQFCLGFSDERTFFAKTFSEKYWHISLFSHPIVVSICVCLNAKIRNVCEKILSVVYANDKVSRNVCLLTILDEKQIFLNEAK